MTLKILLADDNLKFASTVKQCLATVPGTEVVGHALDGHQALMLAAQLRPDVLLLDLMMPGVNGLEVARSMLAWAQAPRIVVLSLHDNSAYRNAARELGASDFVGKADFVTELLPIIENLARMAITQGAPC